MKISQGILNGKVAKLNGDKDKFDELVKDLPRENQVKAWRTFVTMKALRGKQK